MLAQAYGSLPVNLLMLIPDRRYSGGLLSEDNASQRRQILKLASSKPLVICGSFPSVVVQGRESLRKCSRLEMHAYFTNSSQPLGLFYCSYCVGSTYSVFGGVRYRSLKAGYYPNLASASHCFNPQQAFINKYIYLEGVISISYTRIERERERERERD